jgi:Serine carboxypeptidase
MYVSGLAHYIHQQNKKVNQEEKHINLGGIALGNAWLDATIQGPAVIDYAWWHGLIDTVTRDGLHTAWKLCYNNNNNNNNDDNDLDGGGGSGPTNRRQLQQPPQPQPINNGKALLHPFTVPDECGIMSVITEAAGAHQYAWGSPNIYDVTTWDKYDLIIADNSTIEGFLNRPEVRAALNVPRQDADRVWRGCLPGSGRRRRLTEDNHHHHQEDVEQHSRHLLLLDEDRPISMIKYIATLLDDAKIPVLIYHGDRDLSTCAQGSELVLNALPWRGARDWQDPRHYTRGVWLGKDKHYPAGYAKTLHNLNFVVVYNSGHLVPMNQPQVALDMLERFLQNQSFIDRTLPSYSSADFVDPGQIHPRQQHHHHHDYNSATVVSSSSQRPWWTVPFISFVGGILVTVVATRLLGGCYYNDKNRQSYAPIGEC